MTSEVFHAISCCFQLFGYSTNPFEPHYPCRLELGGGSDDDLARCEQDCLLTTLSY
jgi:hypothetical protein